MKPRTIALITLIVIILIPMGLYWYFYSAKVTTLIFENSEDLSYQITLK